MDAQLLKRTIRHLRIRRRRVRASIVNIERKMEHLEDHDLERYHLGMVAAETELAPLEEHLLGCAECVERAEQAAEFVSTLRAAMAAIHQENGQ